MSHSPLDRLRRDDRVEALREQSGTVEVVLSEQGLARLFDDPDGLVDELQSYGAPVRPRPELPDGFIDRFGHPQWPRFLHLKREPRSASLVGCLQPDLHWLEGHFPDDPILPGVVQLHWAVLLGRALLDVTGPFQGLDALKFQHVLIPGRHFILNLEFDPDKRRLRFAYRHAGGHYSQGRVRFGQTGAT